MTYRKSPTFIIDHSQKGERNEHIPTDVAFYSGDPGRGIYHRFRALDGGIIGDDVASFPTHNDWLYIPHQPFRRDIATVQAGGRTVDDTAYIPAWTVGDPIP